ncbi:MAG TPA: competence/damage-inducible protein A [Polyangiaceae bacterium]|nr:competence/damage-inducible protein A [Polyangiaceae bacterium]
MTAAVLCIGTELTRGELTNTNASWLAESLTALGLEVTALDCVDDDRVRIEACLRRLAAEHQVLICTGGLGPTTDDITTECAARVAEVALERDQATLDGIEQRLLRFGRKMAASNAKQADFPAGARVLPNPNGTAPGFRVELLGTPAYFMPGVPSEMKAMFETSLAPELKALVTEPRHQIVLRSFGLPESEVNDRLAGIEASFEVVIGYRATLPEIEVKVLARAASPEVAARAARKAADEARSRLGDHVYAEGFGSLPESVGALLAERGLTLAVAESCTGGLAAELLTRAAGSSRYFLGGAVVYANPAKTELLGVAPELIAQHGAVSTEVARAMAEGVRARLGADIGLAFTGIAGPDGGTAQKPVGLVHWAASSKAGTEARDRVFIGDRQAIRRRAVFAGLDLVRRNLPALRNV